MGTILGIIFGLVMLCVLYGISWLVSCGLMWLICSCFGWAFSWKIATGIWIIMCIVKSCFSGSSKK